MGQPAGGRSRADRGGQLPAVPRPAPTGAISAELTGADLARLDVQVPGAGRVDRRRCGAATPPGNESEAAASVPVTLRYDPAAAAARLRAAGRRGPDARRRWPPTDDVSGVADGAIEISQAGSGTWQALATEQDGRPPRRAGRRRGAAGGGLSAAGARACDQAGNEASTDRAAGRPAGDGHAAAPDRLDDAGRLRADPHGAADRPATRQAPRGATRVRRHWCARRGVRFGRPRAGRRAARRSATARASRTPRSTSSRARRPGRSSSSAALRTDRDGRYRFTARGSTSRTLRFAYAGSPLIAARAARRSRCACPPRTLAARQPPQGAQRPGRHLPRALARRRPAAAERQARRAAGAPLQPLADLPHGAHRRARALVDPLSLPAHARRAALPLPRTVAAGGRATRSRPAGRASLVVRVEGER